MIGPGRQLHLKIWVLSSIILPAILAGVYFAQTEDVLSDLPEKLRPLEWAKGDILVAGNLLPGKLDYQIIQTEAGTFITLARRLPLKLPDVLLYAKENDGPEKLIGSVSGAVTQTLPLELNEQVQQLRLSLYSLGHQETLADLTVILEGSP